MENIYRATELISEAYGKFIGDASPEVRTWLVHKLKHTFGVAHDIMDIFQNEKAIYHASPIKNILKLDRKSVV